MTQEYRPCKCKATGPQATEMARRAFLKRVLAAGAAGALITYLGEADIEALYAAGKAGDAAAVEKALEEWTRQLWEFGATHVYREAALEHIAFPLGGIGAGQIYLTGRGRLTSWQIQNNFRHDLKAPGALFAVQAATADGVAAARWLHEDPDDPDAVKAIEAECEYPFFRLRYRDEALPVTVQLDAWSPFEALNTKDSALPVALFTFSIANEGNKPAEASLLVSIQNKIGWDGYSELGDAGLSGLDYLGNENHFERDGEAARLHFQTRTGDMPRLSKPCSFCTPDFRTAQFMRYCEQTRVYREFKDIEGAVDTQVFWLGPGEAYPVDAEQNELLGRIDEGAGLVLADNGDGILSFLGSAGEGSEEVEVFEDFESGGYANWQIIGDCFGAAPATGTLSAQQPVEGYRGQFLANTFYKGDTTTGKAVSRPFVISRKYVHFLIGGGKHPEKTCINLVVNGGIVRTALGRNEERLHGEHWDVSEFHGKEAMLEIVDASTEGWGHLNIDHIVFSDSALTLFMDPALIQACREALPFSFSTAERVSEPAAARRTAEPEAGLLPDALPSVSERLRFNDFQLHPGARVLAEAEDGTPLIIVGTRGEGRIVICNGLYSHALLPSEARRLAGALAGLARDAAYRPQTGWSEEALPYGTMALCATGGDGSEAVAALPQWEDQNALWKAFSERGTFEGLSSPEGPAVPGRTWNGALSAKINLAPGEKKTMTFLLAWHFPNRMRDHRYIAGPPPFLHDYRLGNKYNNWFANAGEAADYVVKDLARLEKAAHAFHDTFYATTLPRWLLDAISATIANLRSPLYLWLEDGTVAAYEGTDCCCPMNCTHVFNYVMTPAFLFPDLERNVRETDLLVQMHPKEHYIPHRTVLPLSAPRLGDEIGGPHHPALDGELGTILKTCREWRQSGDTKWLKKLWPSVKTHLVYIMGTHDPDGTGVIRGEQPNTYDTHLYGSNTFIGTLYLAALLATERMAKAMEDAEFAEQCRQRYETGRAGYDAACWDGEYYYNVYDAPESPDRDYNRSNCWGPGCHADQLLGQWWANLLGLGPLLPEDHTTRALESIYQYCWRGRLDLPEHKQRVFAHPWERGLLNCAWPKGGRPEHPILYCDEVWTGIEYEVAALLFQEKKVEQALQVIKAARDRYTGVQRNPLSEVECGDHYARAMSSYSLLLAAAGLEYDAPEKRITLAPRLQPENFTTFLTCAEGWGLISQVRGENSTAISVRLTAGTVELGSLRLARDGNAVPVAKVNREIAAQATVDGKGWMDVLFAQPVTITESEPLTLEITFTA
ncbi:MAG: hypothetical protein BWY09_00409 [Candidatus Hydrogenedentes bacterium ADurb.Bin179]|nr:MAG: hypothetical protein BWY09_00409 [Candidatus Hydrogenedentes bacterium ADurb.Bin179]